jgi:hypothetical protein
MSLELTELEVRIRGAVTVEDFESALRLTEDYTRHASSLLRTCGQSDRGRAILERHAALIEWVRLSAASFRAHSAARCALLARAAQFRESPGAECRTRAEA